ncbi:DUF692 family multinuclear iron-containing protein, partial [Nocardia sp. NPDC060259]|uniref:multinuclear nonheme iron-dependent oxidase n=1 Tax=Nocardia sp. NPDC060259 TaxID=3347088 RepID=UPI00365CA35E
MMRTHVTRYGVAYRQPYRHEIFSQSAVGLGCVEITAEQFLPLTPSRRDELERLSDANHMLVHGLNLNVGSVNTPCPRYMNDVSELLDITGAPFFSDHLAITKVGEVALGHFAPVWFTEGNLSVAIRNIDIAQRAMGVRLVLETITSHFDLPAADMELHEFMNRVCTETGCGVLLDISNIYINSRNQARNPMHVVENLNSGNVVQFHLAGFTEVGGVFFDSHNQAIDDRVWSLYEGAIRVHSPTYIVIERDGNHESLNALLRELEV